MTDLQEVTTEELVVELNRRTGDVYRPIRWVCDRLAIYCRALRDGGEDGPFGPDEAEALRQYGERIVFIASKSNLLGRLLYDGEPLRTEPCPVHKGRWSGCPFPGDAEHDCECMHYGNLTGWLPSEDKS